VRRSKGFHAEREKRRKEEAPDQALGNTPYSNGVPRISLDLLLARPGTSSVVVTMLEVTGVVTRLRKRRAERYPQVYQDRRRQHETMCS
jgi:hypothetical protein